MIGRTKMRCINTVIQEPAPTHWILFPYPFFTFIFGHSCHGTSFLALSHLPGTGEIQEERMMNGSSGCGGGKAGKRW